MSDYPWLPLSDLLSSIVGGGTPPRGEPSFWSGDIPWASVKDFEDGRLSLSNTQETISEKGLLNSTAKLIPAGTPIMCARMAVGRVALNSRPVAINQDLKALLLREEVNSKYLCYLIQHFQRELDSNAIGSTVKGISTDAIKRFKVPYVESERVQQTIASILTTIDNQIDATQALIDKYTAIKQGMMADLFSRGIDPETKALRPKTEQAPERYKKTPLGMLPKEWDVVPASTICERVIDCKNRTPPERNEGFAVIKTSNIKNGELMEDSLTFTDGHSYHLWTARGIPQPGDVVITREAPVGESFLITDEMPSMCLGQRTMLYRPDPEAIQPMFMYFATRSPRFMKKLIDMAGGSTVGHVRVGDIKDMVFPKPELVEQELISQVCLSISNKLRSEKEFLEKLISQKAGLMQDLLTGKVPVPA